MSQAGAISKKVAVIENPLRNRETEIIVDTSDRVLGQISQIYTSELLSSLRKRGLSARSSGPLNDVKFREIPIAYSSDIDIVGDMTYAYSIKIMERAERPKEDKSRGIRTFKKLKSIMVKPLGAIETVENGAAWVIKTTSEDTVRRAIENSSLGPNHLVFSQESKEEYGLIMGQRLGLMRDPFRTALNKVIKPAYVEKEFNSLFRGGIKP